MPELGEEVYVCLILFVNKVKMSHSNGQVINGVFDLYGLTFWFPLSSILKIQSQLKDAFLQPPQQIQIHLEETKNIFSL